MSDPIPQIISVSLALSEDDMQVIDAITGGDVSMFVQRAIEQARTLLEVFGEDE